MPDTHLILHVKGTESQTTELPKQAVRVAIAKGQITHSQLIWSVAENAWKQVRELPHLLPSQKLAPAPRLPTSPLPKVDATATPTVQAVPTARVAVKATATPVPVARATSTAKTVSVKKDLSIKEDDSNHPLKWLCIGLGIVIFLALGFNYLMVDEPLNAHLGETAYGKVPVHGHLGAFVQPNVLVIHVWSASSLKSDQLTPFLVALAHSTPQSPVTNTVFDRVAITSGWLGEYSFSGYAWKQLGQMGQDDPGEQRGFVMNQLGDAAGQPLVPPSTLNPEAQQAMHDKIWNTFAAKFSQP